MKTACLGLALAACSSAKQPPPPPIETVATPTAAPVPAPPAEPPVIHTVAEFYAEGTPTLVAGTNGGAHSAAAVRGQAAMIRALAFPSAQLVDDIALARDRKWPPHPVLYGGDHVNHVIDALRAALPFTVTANRLQIGDLVREGDDLALVAVVPASPPGPDAHPEFLLYAGTGSPGIAEINTVADAQQPITIADAFGKLATGTWKLDAEGNATAVLSPLARRLDWRGQATVVHGNVDARFRIWAKATSTPAQDAAAIAACTAGIETSATALAADVPTAVTIYLHPDRGSKRALTGNAGDGNAVPFARALHVVGDLDPKALAPLVAHEVTHVLAAQTWGQPGSPLFAEGLAVFVSGQYGGQTLDELARSLPSPPPPIADLIGPTFRKLPERTAYGYGALLVRAAIAKLGIATVRDTLYGATANTWREACAAAHTTTGAMDALLAAAITTPPQSH